MAQEKQLKVPQHVAIIMDGNGRWAKKRFLPRNAGHTQGLLIPAFYHTGLSVLDGTG